MVFENLSDLKKLKDILSNHYLIDSNASYNRRTFLRECNLQLLIDEIQLDSPTNVFVSNLVDQTRDNKDLLARFLEAYCVLYEDHYKNNEIEFLQSILNSLDIEEKQMNLVVPQNGQIASCEMEKKDVKKVFINYAKEDYEHALQIYTELKIRGIKPWLDREDILPGQRWKDEIRKAIAGCDYFIALLSNCAITKIGYTHTEVEFAFETLAKLPRQKIFIIPALIEECEIEDERLKQLHWVHLYPSFQNGFVKILRVFGLPETIVFQQDSLSKHSAISSRIINSPTNKMKTGKPKIELEFVYIPPGELVVHLNNDNSINISDDVEGRNEFSEPNVNVLRVSIKGFYMSRYPVTNSQYIKFLESTPDIQEPAYCNNSDFNQPYQPIVGVSWYEAERFAEWAGSSLPSEFQWEYACRAGTFTNFYIGDEIEKLERVCWYSGNSGERLHDVGQREPNPLGLYDMHGNVLEWCEDDWHEKLDDAPLDGSAWIDEPRKSFRVIRGGSFKHHAYNCRSDSRSLSNPKDRAENIGIRLVRVPESVRILEMRKNNLHSNNLMYSSQRRLQSRCRLKKTKK